ncbi:MULTISPECIES: hypothetical protein [unclassified Haladaptatus]|nr:MULTISPECIES: hypothetical protein [unclassified Haladaptatus]
MNLPAQFDHASFTAALGTFLSYGILLVVMTVVLFGLPYLAFLALGA